MIVRYGGGVVQGTGFGTLAGTLVRWLGTLAGTLARWLGTLAGTLVWWLGTHFPLVNLWESFLERWCVDWGRCW